MTRARLICGAGFWMLAVLPVPAQTLPILPDGTYEFVAGNSGLALAANGYSDGSAAVQQTYTAAADQQWAVTNLGGNTVELALTGTTEALESPGSSTSAGVHLDISRYIGASGQQWNVVAVSGGSIEFVNVASGYAINVSGNSTSSGATLCQWNANASSNERWSTSVVSGGVATQPPPPPTLFVLTVNGGSGGGSYAAGTTVAVSAGAPAAGMAFAGWTGSTSALASASLASTTLTMPAGAASITATYSAAPPPPTGTGSSILANGNYTIVSENSGLALAATAAGDSSAVVQQVYSGAATQQWNVTNLGEGAIELTLAGTQEALETPNGATAAGANLDVSTYEGEPAQEWVVETPDSGEIELVNVASGYAVNVSGNSTSAGTRMCQWNANGSSNELWTFTALAMGGTGNGTGTGTGTNTGTGSGTATTALPFFGVASDAAQTSNCAAWMPAMAAAGIGTTRLAASWNQVEPTRGVFNYSGMDTIVGNAATNHLVVQGLLGFNPSWVNTNGGAFPTGSLGDWSTFVGNMVSRYSGQISQWEVWNEPDTATNSTPADYATTVAAAYTAAKAANSQAQIGLTVSEVNVNWLREVIADGAADHFDYIAVHPYTVLFNMSNGWEGDYLGIVKTIRAMLAATDPNRVNVPIIFTELGDQIGYSYVTPAIQAGDLVKAEAMGLAEGVTSVDWFEAEDGDSGPFGLLDGTATPRPSYSAMKSVTAAFGANPAYQGWVLLNNQDYAFVFNNGVTAALAAWAPPGATDSVTFSAAVQVINPQTGASSTLEAGTALLLTNLPQLVVGVPADVLAEAQANKSAPFPWKGNFAGSTTVSIQTGNPNVELGLHQMSPSSFTPVQVQGAWVEDVSSQSGQNYMVDPNVLAFTPSKIQVTVVVMAKDSNAGFNFKYESVNDFEGIGWNGIPNDGQWHTFTFSPTDDEFVGKWGYNFQLNSDSTSHSNYYLKSVTLQLLH